MLLDDKNIKIKEKELQNELLNKLIPKINKYYEIERSFCLRDLLSESEGKDYYFVYLTKGVIVTLLYFGYIEVYGIGNGKNNFIYKVKKKI